MELRNNAFHFGRLSFFVIRHLLYISDELLVFPYHRLSSSKKQEFATSLARADRNRQRQCWKRIPSSSSFQPGRQLKRTTSKISGKESLSVSVIPFSPGRINSQRQFGFESQSDKMNWNKAERLGDCLRVFLVG